MTQVSLARLTVIAALMFMAIRPAQAQTHDANFPAQMSAINHCYVARILNTKPPRPPMTNEEMLACMEAQGFRFCNNCQVFLYSGGPCRDDKTWGPHHATCYRPATADGCAVVLKTPDGFLNLRDRPMMRSKIITRLKPGQWLGIGKSEVDGWTMITSIGDRDVQGWVNSRFIVSIDCEALIASTTERRKVRLEKDEKHESCTAYPNDPICIRVYGKQP